MVAFFDYIQSLPLLELAAMILALAYVIFAAKGSLWCWPAAFFSTALYTYIFYDVLLLMDSMLHIYYMLMAVYGYWIWQKNSQVTNSQANDSQITNDSKMSNINLVVISWQVNKHIKSCVLLTLIAIPLGYIMANYTQAAFPYIDTFTTVFSVFATYLVAQKVLENWIYWFVIDLISIFLYIEKDLQPTATLFVLYLFITVYGYIKWHALHKQSKDNRNNLAAL